MQNLKDRAEAASEILKKFSVQYLQLWINEDVGTVFCLIEGPNRAICEAVHKSIYGIDFETFTPVKECLALEVGNSNNDLFRIKTGFFLAVFDTSAERDQNDMGDDSELSHVVRDIIESHGGVCVSTDERECTQAYFSHGMNGLECGAMIQSTLMASQRSKKFKIALLPSLIAKDDAEKNLCITRAYHMQSICGDSTFIVAPTLRDFVRNLKASGAHIRLLNPHEEIFLIILFRIIDAHLQDDEFNVDSLARYIGISRPQLYRKVHALTSRSPNAFIRDLRMEKSLMLLRKSHKNICEIAFEVGYTNPSYFARTFSEKYGCTPSEFLLHSTA